MATITWTGKAGDGNYSNPANWSPMQVPGVLDTVTISEAAATAINASNGAALSLTTSKSVTLNVSNQSNFTFGSGAGTSTFSNAGTFALNSGNQATDLIVGDSKLTLSGGGIVMLSNNGGNGIVGAAAGDQLVNTNNTIEGGGSIGASLTLTNSAAGTIDGNVGTPLYLNTGSAVITNAGLFEATAGGALVLQSVVNDGTTGKITAAGGTVYLQGADLQGGTLSSSGGFAVTVQGDFSATLDGTTHAIDNTGLLTVNNQGTISVLGSIINTGTIALQSTNQATDFVVGPTTGHVGTVTLSGAGTLTLSDNGGNRIYAAQAGDTLVNQSTIAGAGQFGIGAGNYTLGLVNTGTIDATGGNDLVINTGSTITNSALLEATNPTGGLVLQATVNDSTGGTVLASGANVYLQGADIIGGQLKSSGVGAIIVQGNQSATLDGTTQTVTNAGQIDINNQGTLSLLGTLTNTGTIALQSTNQDTDFVANTATVTLTGGGSVLLSDNGGNRIYGATTATVLDNVNNTISGAGQIGASQLTLINAGTISATGGTDLYLNGDTLITNTALLEAMGTGGLVFQNTTVNDSSGGTIYAGTSNVYLQTTTVKGGLLKTSTTQAVEIQGNQSATLDGSASSVTNSGNLQIDNQGTVTLLGTFNNAGAVALNSTNQATDLIVGSNTVSLTGGGTVTLSNNGGNRIYGATAGDVLDNVNNTIVGAGQIGIGQLTLVNTLHGTINANQGTGLTIDTSGETVTNAGLIESTNTGGLAVVSTVIANTGTISANGGNVYLYSSTLAGGLLSAGNGGEFIVTGNNMGTLDGSSSTVTLTGPLALQNQATLSVLGTLLNETTVSLDSTNQPTDLIVGPASGTAGTFTLSGSGTVTLTDNPGNRIYGAQAADTLLNLNNTIQGAGALGAGQLVLVNDSLIDATGGTGLVINTGSTVINNGVMEATNPSGGLVIQSTINSSGGGAILAAGGNVYLQGGVLQGGLINSSGGAVVNVQSNQTGSLDGTAHAVTNKGTVTLSNQGTLNIAGSIVNNGTIALQSTNQATDLIVSSAAATLTGAGTINLSDNPGNRIYGAVGTDVLDNVNNIIIGAGQLGSGQLTLINAGTIEQAGGNSLVLNTGGIAATNSGLLEATGTGGLVIQTVVSNTGTILAAGGNVYLEPGTIQGGTLNSSGGAAFVVQGNNSGTLDGSAHTITNAGSFAIQNQGTLSVLGSLVNTGTIALQSTNQNTDLIVSSPKLTLSGSGTIALSDNPANRIYGAATADVLDNVNSTIEGSGQFGAAQLTLINGGTIAATGGNALVVNLGSTGTITATGQMLGEGSGGLIFQNGTYTNSGLIQADNGSSVTFQTGAVLTNDSSKGTLSGGSYGAVSTGNDAILTVSTGVAVTTLDANLILSGAGSEIVFGTTAIETSLKTIGRTGELQVLGSRGYASKAHITNNGTIVLAGGTFKPGALKDTATGTLSGFGTVAAKFTDLGSVVATGGTLDLTGRGNSITGTASGTGTLAFGGGSDTLTAGTVLDVSTIALLNKATLDLAANVSFAGTFDVSGIGTIAGAGTFTNTGLFEATSKGAGTISAPFANSGTISVAANDSLAFSGGLSNSGLILDQGTFTDTAALTGGSLTLGGTSSSATIASGGGAGPSTLAKLTTAGGALDTSGTTLTVTGDYVNTAAGTGNSYMPFAGVTGTIDGQGTQMSVMGVNGTTVTSNGGGTYTVSIVAGGSASFVIDNSGPGSAAALRGALQTTVNGGHLTSGHLSGSGVTAGNFGPIGGMAESGTYTIDYSGGGLSGQSIHLESDFANVAGITIDIVAKPSAPATLSLSHEPDLRDVLVLPRH